MDIGRDISLTSPTNSTPLHRHILSSHGSQSPQQINAFTSLFVTFVQLCYLNQKNEIAPKNKKITTFTLIIDIIRAIIVFADVQHVHIC